LGQRCIFKSDSMHIVVASSSAHRQALYRDAIEGLGHQVSTVSGGVECIERLRTSPAELLLLEAPLLWGGSDGVLDLVRQDQSGSPQVIVVAVGSGSIDWFQLSRFRVDDFLFRVPTAHELERAIRTLSNQQLRRQADAINKRTGEAGSEPSLPPWSAAATFGCQSQHPSFAAHPTALRGA
jgi:CheY-like chemotaxis protein